MPQVSRPPRRSLRQAAISSEANLVQSGSALLGRQLNRASAEWREFVSALQRSRQAFAHFAPLWLQGHLRDRRPQRSGRGLDSTHPLRGRHGDRRRRRERGEKSISSTSGDRPHSAARRACCRAVAWWTIAFAFVVGKLNGVRGKTGTVDPFWLSDWLAVGLPWSTAELLGTILYEHPVVAPQVAHLRQVPLRASVKLPHSAQESPV